MGASRGPLLQPGSLLGTDRQRTGTCVVARMAIRDGAFGIDDDVDVTHSRERTCARDGFAFAWDEEFGGLGLADDDLLGNIAF